MADELLETNLSLQSNCGDSLVSYVVCALNNDDALASSCQGDSGGPLFCGGVQVGITSYGQIDCTMGTQFTSVFEFKKWIYKNQVQTIRPAIVFLFFILLRSCCELFQILCKCISL